MTAESPIRRQKSKLRDRFRAYRHALAAEEYEDLSSLIVDKVKGLPELEAAGTIHLYWPIVDQREVDTRPLFPWLEALDKQIILPKVLLYGRGRPHSPRLLHVRYPGKEELKVNKWGIAEPTSDEAVDITTLDLVIVPALGAGLNGHRIGHGYGYYDEFLDACAAPTIGLVYEECLVDRVPCEPHDVPLDLVITERSVIRVSTV